MKQARRSGLAVLLVSADLDELIGLSDTLLVMYGGRIVATLDPATVTPAELGSYMTGAHETDGRRGVRTRIVYALAAPVVAARPGHRACRRSRCSLVRQQPGRRRSRRCGSTSTRPTPSSPSSTGPCRTTWPAWPSPSAFKMSLFNIGVDGQYRLAALLAAAAGAAVTLPAPAPRRLHLPGRHRRRRRLRRHRRHPEGLAGRERGRLDDHAQLHRHRASAPSSWPSTSGTTRPSLVAETKPIPPSGVAPAAEPAARGVRLPPARPARCCRASCPSPS